MMYYDLIHRHPFGKKCSIPVFMEIHKLGAIHYIWGGVAEIKNMVCVCFADTSFQLLLNAPFVSIKKVVHFA